MTDYQPYLDKAVEAARAAEAVIRHYYEGNVAVEMKADRTPVTVADVESEKAIHAVLEAAFPEHGFFGEETGKSNPDAEFTWLVDPIDGTKGFVRQYPVFSTQIALMHGSELVVGVSNAPLYNGGELACACKGGGASLNGVPIRVSGNEALEDVALSTGNIATLAGSDAWAGLGRLCRRVNRTRGYGDFLHYHLLASGKIELIVESDVNILDIAALAVIVREAGGVFTDLHGGELDLDTTDVLAANSPAVYDRARELLFG